MSHRIALGIALEGSHLRVACLRGAVLAWVLDSEVGDALDPGTALGELLSRAPLASCRGASAGIAIGPPLAQLRQIGGLPAVADHRTVAAAVATSPHRWFLARPGGLTIGAIEAGRDGSPMAAAYPRSTLDGLCSALGVLGLRVEVATYSTVATLAAHGGATIADLDQAFVNHLDTQMAGADSCSGTDPATADRPAAGNELLSGLGERGHEFEAAVGVALLAGSGRPVPFAVPMIAQARTQVGPRRARTVRIALLTVVIALLASQPAAVSMTAIQLARQERRGAVADRGDTLARTLVEAEAELSAFRSRSMRRVSLIAALESIRRALPSDAAVVAFRLDSTDGVLTVLGTRVGTFADRLAEVGAVRAPRLIGAVTSEAVGTVILERATIAFALPRPEDR